MLDRLVLPNFRRTLCKIMGVPERHSIHQLDDRLVELERELNAWARKVEKSQSVVHRRVLLADTEAASFETLRNVLPKTLELKMVKDWDQLFKETRKAEVPLIVIDLALLGQEGVRNIRKLKGSHPQIQVVALSNYLSETLAQAMPEGLELAGILQKPLAEEALKENLNRYLA